MNIKDLDDTWGSLETYSVPELHILDDHILGMLYKLQDSENKEAIDYWTSLSAMVKGTIEERSLSHV